MSPEEHVTGVVIGMEEAAPERWGKGDPDGFLEISAPDGWSITAEIGALRCG